MELNMIGKTVVVTGGSTGIGFEAAKEFAREGANVVICGRSGQKLASAAAEFAAEGMEAATFAGDMSRIDEIYALADYAAGRFGGIDVWLNNAGTGISKKMMEFTVDDIDTLIDINFKSVYWGCRAAAERMMGRGGVILNTTSFAVKMPLLNGGIYAACKCAAQSLTKSFAAELAPHNIRVVSIIPGFIETPLTAKTVEQRRGELTRSIPAGRLGRPEDLAKTIVFLASEAAGYIPGVPVEISGGKYAVQDPWNAWI